MSLPPLLLFEYHWDPLPKQLVQTLLPELTDLGYNTYCLEAPEDVSYPDLKQRYIEGLQSDEKISSDAQQLLAKRKIIVKEQDLIDMSYDKLSKLMNQFVSSQVVSSQGFKYVAEHIKGLPVTRLMGYLFNQMEELSIDIKPIDLGSKDHDTMMSKNDPSERMNLIKKNEVRRIATMSKNILQLYKEGRGVIFLCGALHASNLITALKKSGLDNIVYYFVYPSKRYVDSLDNVQLSLDNNAASDKENGNKELTLEGHTQLLTESTIAPFSRKVIQQILPQIRYIKQIQGGNSHSQFLSSLFVAPFCSLPSPWISCRCFSKYR